VVQFNVDSTDSKSTTDIVGDQTHLEGIAIRTKTYPATEVIKLEEKYHCSQAGSSEAQNDLAKLYFI